MSLYDWLEQLLWFDDTPLKASLSTEISVGSQMESFVLVSSDQNIRDRLDLEVIWGPFLERPDNLRVRNHILKSNF